MRLHVLGASGSGTSTLGLALAEHLGVAHLDTDDYYWLPTDPPFETPRPMPERLARLEAALDAAGRWVLSGSLCGWGDPLIPRFERVVFLRTETGVRLARLSARERDEYGAEAVAPGGRMHENFVAFLDWAAQYDTADLDMRSLARHRAWLEGVAAPVMELDGETPVDRLVARVVAALPPR
jgi:adenylate kinase family enzyme